MFAFCLVHLCSVASSVYEMDAQAKKKAFFRAKLNAQKQEKQRINSPLIRYNEHDQLVCRVCDVVVKSDSMWPAHQASRKHHEAIDKLKAAAAAPNLANKSKLEHPKNELPKPNPESIRGKREKSEPSNVLQKPGSSTLPPDFFDNHEAKRKKQNTEKDSEALGDPISFEKDLISAKAQSVFHGKDGSTSAESTETINPESESLNESKQVKGSLPEGFFDDKNSDLLARGITPVKLDVKDEYKEFEKLIKDDLQEVDNRFEEEEYDAADVNEEAETVEQRACKERVETFRRKKLELKASKSAHSGGKDTQVKRKESIREDSSTDDEENYSVDWRAKHL